MTPPEINSSHLAPALIGLFAFVVAYYTLLARERKSPLITTTVARVAVAGLVALFFGICERLCAVAMMLSPVGSTQPSVPPPAHPLENIRLWSLVISGGLLVVAVVLMFWRIFRIHNIQNRLRSDRLFRNTKTYLWIKTHFRQWRGKPTFEHNASSFTTAFLDEASRLLNLAPSLSSHQSSTSLAPSLLISGSRLAAEARVAALASLALQHKLDVLYMTCSRHPFEFVSTLQRSWDTTKHGDWKNVVAHILIVDGFVTHFGFADSVHLQRALDIERQGITYVRSGISFSGLHTAAATVFNKVKRKKDGLTTRPPQIVIYEGLAGLTDLESTEQFRIFFRHVIPSERQWGGMLTVVVEPGESGSELDFLRSLIDFPVPTHTGGLTNA